MPFHGNGVNCVGLSATTVFAHWWWRSSTRNSTMAIWLLSAVSLSSVPSPIGPQRRRSPDVTRPHHWRSCRPALALDSETCSLQAGCHSIPFRAWSALSCLHVLRRLADLPRPSSAEILFIWSVGSTALSTDHRRSTIVPGRCRLPVEHSALQTWSSHLFCLSSVHALRQSWQDGQEVTQMSAGTCRIVFSREQKTGREDSLSLNACYWTYFKKFCNDNNNNNIMLPATERLRVLLYGAAISQKSLPDFGCSNCTKYAFVHS